MLYLIIPIVCFLLFAAFFWLVFLTDSHEFPIKGDIGDLDWMLSRLMEPGSDTSLLVMRVSRRVTWLKMSYADSVIKLELPLITAHQKNQRESYLAICHDLGLAPAISKNESDVDILEWEVDGPPDRASAIIKEIFAKLFDVSPNRLIEFRTFPHGTDHNAIRVALSGHLPKTGTEKAAPVNQGPNAPTQSEPFAGCLVSLAEVFLLPVPFVIAYLEFGSVVASIVLIVILVARQAYRRWRGTKVGFRFGDSMTLAMLGLCSATVYFGDPFYLQLIPTTLFSVAGMTEIFRRASGLPPVLLMTGPNNGLFSLPAQMWLSFGTVATCMGGIVLNEYMRTNVTLDIWIWFYAFARIELIFGFLIASIPFFIHQVRNGKQNEADPL